jgi:rod shape-determining protein MreD
MPRLLLTISILFLFLIESTVIVFFSPTAWGMSMTTVPRFALVGTILCSLFIGRREGLFYGMVIGFLHDIVMGQIIGVYTLTMMVAGYFAGLVSLLFHRSFAVVFCTVLLVIFGHEWLLYSFYRLFYTSPVDVQWFLNQRILPTVICNLIFALLVYLPFVKMCEKIKEKRERQHE